MQTFDYAHAWVKMARPAWLEISAVPEIRQLFDIVKGRSDLQQDKALNVPIPSGDFETIAAKLDTLTLAKAARAAYFFGHWSPGLPTEAGDGSGWKFSNILDQIISKRLGMQHPHYPEGPGLSFRCMEGTIRAQFSTNDCWTWHEISYATDALFSALCAVFWARIPVSEFPKASREARRLSDDARVKAFDCVCKEYQTITRQGLNEPWAGLLSCDPFMVEESEVLHLAMVAPDGSKASRLTGISASLDVCLQIINEQPSKYTPGTVLMIGTYPEGKSYKGTMSVRLATIAGEDATTEQALLRASEYKLKAEIRKAEETVSKSNAALAALKAQGEAMPRTAADEIL